MTLIVSIGILAVIILGIIVVVVSALYGILVAPLYHYAKTGEISLIIDRELITTTFVEKNTNARISS